MGYAAKMLADSISPGGARLTTFQLTYPRMVHAEMCRHRAFSRSAASTRAVPLAKQVAAVRSEAVRPVFWGASRPGMQATEALDRGRAASAAFAWDESAREAADDAEYLHNLGVHKQICGRLVEPFSWITEVLTGTADAYMNFFALRCHPAAQPEIQAVAVPMARAYRDSTPVEVIYSDGLVRGEWRVADPPAMAWHLPYVSDAEKRSLDLDDAIRVSVARCARVSYLRHDATPASTGEDVALHDRLRDSGHFSPFEHVATPTEPGWRSGNFVGWEQYRQTLPKGVHTSFDFATLDQFEGRDFIV